MSNDVDSILKEIKVQWDNDEIKYMLSVLERREEFQSIDKDRSRKLDMGIECLQKILPTYRKKCLHCNICNSLYIPLVNSFSNCLMCEQEVCSNCIMIFKSPTDMELCRVCHIKRLQKLKSGTWFNEISHIGDNSEVESQLSVLRNKIKITVQSDEELDRNSPVMLRNGAVSKPKTQTRLDELKNDNDDVFNDLSSNSSPSTIGTFSGLSSAIKKCGQSDHNYTSSMPNGYVRDRSYGSTPRSSCYSDGRISFTNDRSLMSNGYVREPSLTTSQRNHSYSARLSNMDNVKDVVYHGEILLLLEYLQNSSRFQVTIYECKDLVIITPEEGPATTYIVMFLLPDKSSNGRRKSTKKKMSTNPIYNETVSYRIERSMTENRTLNVAVWHSRDRKEDVFGGEANIALSGVNFSNPQKTWIPLKMKGNSPNLISHAMYKGELLVGLKYDSSKTSVSSEPTFDNGTLTMNIKHGRNIGSSKNIPSSFVKCSLSYKGSLKTVHKTSIKGHTTNPVWDAMFTYNDIDKNDLYDTKIELLVISKTKALGKLVFTMDGSENGVVECKESDVLFWRHFLDSPNSNLIQDYIPLRACLD